MRHPEGVSDQAPRPDPDDVVGMGRSLRASSIFTMFLGAASAFGGGSLAGQQGPRMSSKVKDMPWWVQVAFGLVLWSPIITVPLFYLVTRSWVQAAIIGACIWVGCTLVGSILISMFAIRGHDASRQEPPAA
jgi:hypothetical protein